MVIGFGAGLVIPFLNLYLKEKFGLSYGATGLVFALSSLATGAAMLLQPLLVRRVGRLGAIVGVQALSLPFWPPWPGLLGFPWSPSPSSSGGLMNAAGPVYAALVMDYLAEEERPASSSWKAPLEPPLRLGKRPFRGGAGGLGPKGL